MARTGLKFNAGDLPYNYSSAGLAASGVVVADSPVRLIRVIVTNNNAAIRYFQLFDSLTVPADTAVPSCAPLVVGGNSTSSIDYGANAYAGGRGFVTGLCWANSSTLATKTLSGSDLFVEIQYM